MTLTFNKSNWSGGTASIRVNQAKRSFVLNGCTYTLRPTHGAVQAEPELFDILSSEHGNSKIGWVGRMTEGTWIAKSEFADITREDANPFVAVAKLMCNL